MEKHLLVTVGQDKRIAHGLRFLSEFIGPNQNFRLTLFHVGEAPDDKLYIGDDSSMFNTLPPDDPSGQIALEHAKESLLTCGFSEEHLNTKLSCVSHAKHQGIIHETEKGMYDAAVMGKRCLSWLDENIGQSMCRSLLDKSISFPVWFCRKPESERRNVLLCVDGAEPSMRIADHVGFILGDGGKHDVTLFSVLEKNQNDEHIEERFAAYRDALMENDFPEQNIHTRVERSNNVAKTILDIADNERYAVVAIGRNNHPEKLFSRLFHDSASATLLRQLTGAVLWCSH